jgi:hypothetical protein
MEGTTKWMADDIVPFGTDHKQRSRLTLLIIGGSPTGADGLIPSSFPERLAIFTGHLHR